MIVCYFGIDIERGMIRDVEPMSLSVHNFSQLSIIVPPKPTEKII